MPLVDDRGRLFGRFNLIDAVVVLALVAVLPLAYAAALLFRPARPQIVSVTSAELDNTDRRLTRGTVVAAKLKVLGSGLTPMLRASVGNTPALAFVFEHPNSADVLVGGVPPGEHDLVLYDGVQEVARAPKAVVINPPATEFIRISGWASGEAAVLTSALKPGFRFPEPNHAFEVVAAGQPVSSTRVSLAGRHTDLPRPNAVQQALVLLARCDPAAADASCAIGGRALGGDQPVVIDLPAPDGSFRFTVDEVFPAAAPVPATVTVAFNSGPAAPAIDDKDRLLDTRAAVVRGVTRSGTETVVRFGLGADRSRDGWHYRGRLLKVGAPFTFETDAYVVTGNIRGVAVDR